MSKDILRLDPVKTLRLTYLLLPLPPTVLVFASMVISSLILAWFQGDPTPFPHLSSIHRNSGNESMGRRRVLQKVSVFSENALSPYPIQVYTSDL